jgi:hypothetical protein
LGKSKQTKKKKKQKKPTGAAAEVEEKRARFSQAVLVWNPAWLPTGCGVFGRSKQTPCLVHRMNAKNLPHQKGIRTSILVTLQNGPLKTGDNVPLSAGDFPYHPFPL